MKKSVCNTCVYAVNNNHCGLRGFRSNFNVNYCSAQNVDKLPNGFELQEDGYFSWVNKKPKYPKTYEECCDIIECCKYTDFKVPIILPYDAKIIPLLENIRKLLICRDTYWDIAGEQMGLGKPWEPDWEDNYQKKWLINFYQGEINFCSGTNVQFVLAFPTEEMRDIFYENFKDLIESCKELL